MAVFLFYRLRNNTNGGKPFCCLQPLLNQAVISCVQYNWLAEKKQTLLNVCYFTFSLKAMINKLFHIKKYENQ